MDNTAYIDDYLEGRLNDQDKAIFNNRLNDDLLFAAEYETHLSAQALVKSIGVYQAKDVLRQHESRTYQKSKPRLLLMLSAAAAVLLLFLAVWFLFVSQKPETNEQLFAEFFTPYRDPVVLRGSEGQEDARGKANEAYRSGDFPSAKLYYSQITIFTPVDKFYYGLSALQSSDDQLAISLLKEMAESKTEYEQQARWYLALAYLKVGNQKNTIDLLEKMMNPSNYNSVKARELMKKLEDSE